MSLEIPIDIRYAIKVKGKYIKSIKANPNYVRGSNAPTMGARHTNSEFTVVFSNTSVPIEKLTVTNYLKVLFTEFTWGEKPFDTITIEPIVFLDGRKIDGN